MKKPFEYFVICNKTGKTMYEGNEPPMNRHLETYEPTEDISIKNLKKTKTAYIDIRYNAKLRLWKYLNKIK